MIFYGFKWDGLFVPAFATLINLWREIFKFAIQPKVSQTVYFRKTMPFFINFYYFLFITNICNISNIQCSNVTGMVSLISIYN